MKRSVIALCLLTGLLSTVAPANAELVSGIVAVVNDDIVTTRDLDKEFQAMAREGNRKEPFSEAERTQLRETACNRLVDRRLVDQKIKELGIKISDEEIRQSVEDVKKQNNMTQERLEQALAGQGISFEQYKRQIREQLERLRLMSQEVKAKVQVTPREAMDYYQANLSRYGGQDLYSARHILFTIPKDVSDADMKKILAKAAEALKEARTGADFPVLAKKYSDDPNAAKDGGDLGTFKQGDLLPEMESVILTMKEGEVSEPIQTRNAFHIIKLEKKSSGGNRTFEEIKPEIEEMLYRQKSEARFGQWVAELRKNAAIEIRP